MIESLARRLIAAARTLDNPKLLVYGPVARGNPYQELIYSDLSEAGVAAVPALPWDQLWSLDVTLGLGIPTAFHLHWTNLVTAAATNPTQAEALCHTFLENLDRCQQSGLHFIWTIHNQLPHGCRFPETEAWFRTELGRRADVIHTMTSDVSDVVEHLYELPSDRVRVVPHPSYIDAYPRYFRRTDCRLRFGIDTHDFVVAAVGAIAPYKNLNALLEGARLARRSDGRRIRVIIAGEMPRTEPGAGAELLSNLESDPNAIIDLRRLPDRLYSEYLTAADVAWSGYDNPLVSGSAMLAITLRRGVLTTDQPRFQETLGSAGFYLTASDPDGVAQVLSSLTDEACKEAELSADALATALSHEKVAPAITTLVDGVFR